MASNDRELLIKNESCVTLMENDSGIEETSFDETATLPKTENMADYRGYVSWGLFVLMIFLFLFPALVIFTRLGIIPWFQSSEETNIVSNTHNSTSTPP